MPARYSLAGSIVLVSSLLLYLPTLLPDVATWDTAEFQTVGPVLGIAHPTGYPTYTLLAWLASVVLQPFGNEAYRANLLSAALMAGAASLVAVRVVQASRRWPLGVLAGLVFAVTPVAWHVSTRADAHALHVFLAALMLVLLAGWQQHQEAGGRRAGRWLVAAAIVFGLSLGNHALTLLLAPGIAAVVLLVSPRILWTQWRLVLACLGAAGLTVALVYAYLPLRSGMDPPLDYADPETWGRFWYVVLGQQFRGSLGGLPAPFEALAGAWAELVRDLGLLAILVPAGVVFGALRQPRLIMLTGLWFVCTWVFALGYANASIERYYLVPLLVASLWMALAADAAWDVLRPVWATRARSTAAAERWSAGLAQVARGAAVGLLVVLLVAAPLASLPGRYDQVDASDETFGRDWLEATLAALEPEAAVISWWSYSTPLWYGRWVEGRREDIVIVDDRDVIDDGFGSVERAIDRFLGERPVYVIRLERDVAALSEHYLLERVETVPSPGTLYRVVGPREDEQGLPA